MTAQRSLRAALSSYSTSPGRLKFEFVSEVRPTKGESEGRMRAGTTTRDHERQPLRRLDRSLYLVPVQYHTLAEILAVNETHNQG